MAIKLPNGKIARTIAEQVYKNMKDIAFLLSKKDFQILVVEELPEEGSENTLYLVPSDNPEQQNVYIEYIWTGTAFEMVGTTAIDISNMVTTDTNQNIIGEKTFESQVTFYDEIVLSVDAAFVGDILPKVNYNDDLGSSAYAWKDLYLGGSLCFDNTEGANWIKVNGDNCCYFDPYILKIYNLEPPVTAPTSSDYYLGTASKRFGSIYVIDANVSGKLDLGNNTKISKATDDNLQIELSGNDKSVKPSWDGHYNLGTTGYRWKDIFFSGNLYNSNYLVIWNNGVEVKNASDQTMFYVAYDKSVWFYGKLTPSGNPDIGDASHKVKDLYLSGVLSDGTNSVNVADLKALIDYAKAQGWIS